MTDLIVELNMNIVLTGRIRRSWTNGWGIHSCSLSL